MIQADGRTAHKTDAPRKGAGTAQAYPGIVECVPSDPSGSGRAAVSFRNGRLHDIAPVLIGKPADAAPLACRRLLPVCGWAQGLSCLSAVQAADGTTPDPDTALARALLAAAESAVAAIRHAAIDWPALLGAPPAPDNLRAAQPALAAIVAQLWPGGAPLDPRARARPLASVAAPVAALAGCLEAIVPQAPASPDALAGWATTSPDPLARLVRAAAALELPHPATGATLPGLEAVAAELAASPAFGARPDSAGRPCDLSLPDGLPEAWRAFGPVGARLLQQAATIGALARALRRGEPTAIATLGPAQATGVARVETLRGPLVQRVALDGQGGARRIAAFASVAPTEWMLHPDGALAQVLGAALRRGLADRVPLIVAGFDPCAPLALAPSDPN